MWVCEWENPLEEEMPTHSRHSCLGNLMDRGAWQATVHGVVRVRHDLATKQQTLYYIEWAALLGSVSTMIVNMPGEEKIP